MSALRIALVTETFYPGGCVEADSTTTTLKAVADRLIDTDHQVRVIAPGPGLASYRSARVHRISPLRKPGRQVRDALADFEPHAVHVYDPGLGPQSIGRKALKHAHRFAMPTLVTQQAVVPDLTWELWRAQIAERADRIAVTAPWMVGRLADREVEAALWTPGVDTVAFNPALRDSDLHTRWARTRSALGPQVVVGFVGGLHRRHGVRRLAELAAVPGIRPVVIGAGAQRDWLAAHLPSAKLVGPLGSQDLATAVASLDMLVHPGEEETCCHALREAAASGVPVVAPRAGGAADVVRHLESGLLYDPHVLGDLARAVDAVAADPRRVLLGSRARELATRTWADAVDDLVESHYHPLTRVNSWSGAA